MVVAAEGKHAGDALGTGPKVSPDARGGGSSQAHSSRACPGRQQWPAGAVQSCGTPELASVPWAVLACPARVSCRGRCARNSPASRS